MSTSEPGDPLAWTREHTPILRSFADEYGESEPFAGCSVAVASHLEAKTGVLIETLAEAGAEVLVTSSEPYSTHADVVAALDERDGRIVRIIVSSPTVPHPLPGLHSTGGRGSPAEHPNSSTPSKPPKPIHRSPK